VQPPTIKCSVSALRFFFTVTLDRPDLSRRLVLVDAHCHQNHLTQRAATQIAAGPRKFRK
jgi:hypothetical protein